MLINYPVESFKLVVDIHEAIDFITKFGQDDPFVNEQLYLFNDLVLPTVNTLIDLTLKLVAQEDLSDEDYEIMKVQYLELFNQYDSLFNDPYHTLLKQQQRKARQLKNAIKRS
jgi:hypothetical protein